jgi:anti-repressor protein
MNELIKIEENNGIRVVSARELYTYLEVNTEFPKWCVRMFDYGFEQDKDYSIVVVKNDGNSKGGRNTLIDYALTTDCAKEISMLQRTEKGSKARKYFIEVEKQVREIAKPQSTLDILKLTIQGLEEQQRGLDEVKREVLELKAQTITRPEYFTIVGWATLHKIQVGLHLAAKLGLKASRICKDMGFPMDEIPDPRFGKVKSYPKLVLQQVFNEAVS